MTNRNLLRPFLSAAVVLASAPSLICAGELVVESNFENANAIVRSIDQENREITIAPKAIREARNMWWHFRIYGIEPGETITINIVDFFQDSGEAHPVYSYDGNTWHRMDDRTTPHRQQFTEPSVTVSRNIPYTYTDSLRLAERLAGTPGVEVLELCVSEGGRPVKMFRFTAEGGDSEKKLIWVQARQHAFESHSSRVAEGLAKWLAGDSTQARQLLSSAVVYVVPVMDVDSVVEGAAGKDQQPVDFNRCWGDQPHWNAVRAVIELIDAQQERHELFAFLDLHNPWYHDGPHWYIDGSEPLQSNSRAFARYFDEAVVQTGAANTWRSDRFNVSSTPPTTRSRGYAAVRWLSDTTRGFTVTKETPHWRDSDGQFITAQGLHDYGRALGKALERAIRRP